MALSLQEVTSLHHNQETQFLNASTQSQELQIQETLFKGAFFQEGKLANFSDNTLKYFCTQNLLNYNSSIFTNTLTFLEADGSEQIETTETPLRVACVNVIYNFALNSLTGNISERLKSISCSLKDIETEAL